MNTEKTLKEWIAEITDWQDKTFTQATRFSAVEHLQREVRELIFDLIAANPKSVRYEVADCFFLLIGVAHLSGIDLEEALIEKMAINKERVWGKPDAQGVVEHVRESKNLFEDANLPEDFRNLFSGLSSSNPDDLYHGSRRQGRED